MKHMGINLPCKRRKTCDSGQRALSLFSLFMCIPQAIHLPRVHMSIFYVWGIRCSMDELPFPPRDGIACGYGEKIVDQLGLKMCREV
jgi:hypothetical protein